MIGNERALVLTRVEEREAGRVAWVTVNNPEKRNILGIAGKKQLAAAFAKLARDKALRAAVLTGGGSVPSSPARTSRK